jgi:hypothetical protein
MRGSHNIDVVSINNMDRNSPPTFTTSVLAAVTSVGSYLTSSQSRVHLESMGDDDINMGNEDGGSTLNGVVIGLLSSFGSAILIALIFVVVYFFKYTTNGRIILDRIGRPGEYDDEQAFAKEEAEALEEMDDLQRSEYLRAKGMMHLS